MRLREVLKNLPGLTKSDVRYWEAQGYIQPLQVPKRRIQRRDYGSAFEKLKLMWGFYRQGMRPEEASREADIALRRGGYAVHKLREEVFNFLVSGSLTLGEKLAQLRASWLRRLSTEASKLASPGKVHAPGEHLYDEAFLQLGVKFTPPQLALLAEACLSALDENVDALVGLSTTMSIVVGATSVLGVERARRSLLPFVLDDIEGTPRLVGGAGQSRLRVALLTERIEDVESFLRIVDFLRFEGHRVRQVLCVFQRLSEGESAKLHTKGIRVSSLFTREFLLTLWESAQRAGGESNESSL